MKAEKMDCIEQKMLSAIEHAVYTTNHDIKCNPEAARSCAKIADENAIEFAEWVSENSWEIETREQRTFTTKELYSLFKSS